MIRASAGWRSWPAVAPYLALMLLSAAVGARWSGRASRLSYDGSVEPRVLHVSEADVVKDIAAVLEKVRQGSEVVVEQNHRPIAVIKPSKPAGRLISEVIAELKARGSNAVIDDDFARDVEAGIEAQREPWNPPSWE